MLALSPPDADECSPAVRRTQANPRPQSAGSRRILARSPPDVGESSPAVRRTWANPRPRSAGRGRIFACSPQTRSGVGNLYYPHLTMWRFSPQMSAAMMRRMETLTKPRSQRCHRRATYRSLVARNHRTNGSIWVNNLHLPIPCSVHLSYSN